MENAYHSPLRQALICRLWINTILVQITWVYFLDKTEGTTDRSSQKLCLVAGACNHPNVPSIPFSFELHPNHLKRKP
jgi:hypothetical protein